jgi:hypothetical protein
MEIEQDFDVVISLDGSLREGLFGSVGFRCLTCGDMFWPNAADTLLEMLEDIKHGHEEI